MITTIHAIPVFRDNYIWALQQNKHCVLVDPGCAAASANFLSKSGLSLSAILITHHHADHVGGLPALCRQHDVPVFGPQHPDIPDVSHTVQDGDHVAVFDHRITLRVMATPGHTHEHLCYYWADGRPPRLFCGDTLFLAGCGRLFEGTATEMFNSLHRLAALPDDTAIYCAHEYTLHNLQFAQMVEPDNRTITERLTRCAKARQNHTPTVPATLAEEKATNPFLRCHLPALQQDEDTQRPDTALATFTRLRTLKDQF